MLAVNYRKGRIQDLQTSIISAKNNVTQHAAWARKEHFNKYFEQLDQVCYDFNLEYRAFFAGTTKEKRNNHTYEVDHWRVNLLNKETKQSISLDYSQGMGRRLIQSRESFGGRAYGHAFIVPPTPLDVLYCIQCDNTRDYTFGEWARDLGYDEDSRKALDTYLVCQKQTENFRATFPGIDLDEYLPLENY